jgi:hypothetical protein
MRRLAAALLLAWLAAGCATRPTHPDAFSFGVMGDVPYTELEERLFAEMLARIDAEPLAFVVHVGDFKGGGPCSDELYARRKSQFDRSAHPFILTPGDNEWVDCRDKGHDPLERLEHLRRVFFADRWSLGRKRLELFVQSQCPDAQCRCPALPENRFWTRAGVRFVTLHLVGSNNNEGRTAAGDAEARCRAEANSAWLEAAVRVAERSETMALVIFIQANPWEMNRPAVYRDFVRQVQAAAQRVRKPVLFVHGDTHIQRVDTPFTDAVGNTLAQITRLETFGSPFVGWVRVTVDPDDPQVFTFEPRLHGLGHKMP